MKMLKNPGFVGVVSLGISLILAAIAVFIFLSRGDADSDSSKQDIDDFLATCEELTISRSYDDYFLCMEYGPAGYLRHLDHLHPPGSEETEEERELKQKAKEEQEERQAIVTNWLWYQRTDEQLDRAMLANADLRINSHDVEQLTEMSKTFPLIPAKIVENMTWLEVIKKPWLNRKIRIQAEMMVWEKVLAEMSNKTVEDVRSGLLALHKTLEQKNGEETPEEKAEDTTTTTTGNYFMFDKDNPRKRIKRQAFPTYPPPKSNESEIVYKFDPIKKGIAMHADYNELDPFNQRSAYLYKYTGTSGKQQQPPWSYRGHYGANEWHKLHLEKFFPPLNDVLGDKESHARLMTAMLTDMHEEHLYTNSDYMKKTMSVSDPKLIVPYENVELPLAFYFYNKKVEGRELPAMLSAKEHTEGKNKKFNMKLHPENRALVNVSQDDGYYTFYHFYLPPPVSHHQRKKYKGYLPINFKAPAESWALSKLRELFDASLNDRLLGKHSTHWEQGVSRIKEAAYKFAESWAKLSGLDPNADANLESIYENLTDASFYAKTQQSRYSLPVFPKMFPICQDKEPSPLDIIRNGSNTKTSSIKPYIFNDSADKYYQFLVKFASDGTNLFQVFFRDYDRLLGKGIRVSGGATRGLDLFFETMFVKVGQTDTTGSEHRLDGKEYGMELQLMFSYLGYSREQPWWFTLARQINDLFAYREKLIIMFSVLVEVNDKLTPTSNWRDFYRFEALAQSAGQYRHESEVDPNALHHKGFNSKDFALRINDFIPEDSKFYTYRGSLTIPPCFSYVLWSVFDKPLQITPEQVAMFRNIPTKGRDATEFFAGSLRHVEDIWVAQENRPGMVHSEQMKLKKKRLERTVLISHKPKAGQTNEDIYDYYFDPDAGVSCSPTISLICSSIMTIFYLTL